MLGAAAVQISKIEEVYAIKKYTPQLTYLDISDNPLCDDKSYRLGVGSRSVELWFIVWE